MKKMRRFAAIAAAAAMTACMAVPMTSMFSASAAYTITINTEGTTTADATHTYGAYQVFAGSLSEGTLGNIVWGAGIDGDGVIADLQAYDAATFGSCASAADVAAKLTAANGYGDDTDKLDAVAEIFYANLGEATAATSSAGKITVENAGYYLVVDTTAPVSDAKSKFMLEVAADAEIAAKRDFPDMEKKVKENVKENGTYTHDNADGTDYSVGYNDVADYNMGDKVPFQLIGTLPSNLSAYDGYYYKFTDTLAAGLTLDTTSVKVYIVNDGTLDNETALTAGTDADYVFTNADAQNFTITFNNIQSVDGVDGDSVVVVEYEATLNQNAQVGLDGNENVANLTYSNNPNWTSDGDEDTNDNNVNDDETTTTPDEKVIVFTYEVDVTKYLGVIDDNVTASADQAGFKLKNAAGQYAVVDGNNKITEWNATGTEVKTLAGGLIKFIGLDDGTYTLEEHTTPGGYNTMEPLTLIVSAATTNCQTYDEAEGTNEASEMLTDLDLKKSATEYLDGTSATGDNVTGATSGIVETYVENLKGSTLPSTGGIGTTIFYVVGGALAAGAGVSLIAKKRMKNED